MRLVGRENEARALRGLLDAARGGSSGVLVVRGEPGIGKTALLQEAADAAADMQVVTVTGVEAERDLGYAALHRLIGPFLDRRAALPAPQRDALSAAFGLEAGVRADRLVLSLAVLTLLAEVAADQPLLCVCDDAQWVDQESLRVAAFLARRLDADPIAMLFGVRDGTGGIGPAADPVPSLADLPTLRLGPLPAAMARTVAVSAAHGRFDELELDRVVAEARGNPLAIRELAVDWAQTRYRPGHGVPLAERLPLGELLERRFRDRVAELPAHVRTLLLVVAAEPTGDADLVWRALTALGATGGTPNFAEAAEPARTRDLLGREPAPIFRHPLVRSAVYDGAEDADRRRVHAALAAAIPDGADADRRAWHLATAFPGPDDGLAGELEQAAVRARERAGYSAEAAFLAAAADRTSDEEGQAQRLYGAGVAAIRAGLPQRAVTLLERVPRGAALVTRWVVALTRGAACVQIDRFDEGMAVMVDAVRELSTALPPEQVREALLEVVQTVVLVPWVDLVPLRRLLEDSPGGLAGLPPQPRTTDLLLDAHRVHLLGTRAHGVAALQRALAALRADASATVGQRWGPMLQATPRELLDDVAMVELSSRAVRLARGDGAATGLRVALVGQGLTETFLGHLASAELYHAEAAQVGAVNGGSPFLRRPHDALLRAWRGDGAGVARAADELPSPPSTALVGGAQVQLVRTAQAVLALATGRYTDALAAARRVHDDDPPYWGHLALPDLVEAGVRGGDRAAAEAALDRFAEHAGATGTPWALGLLARSRALLADGMDAEGLYGEAVDRLAATRVATDLARTHLLYGEWLRRRKRRTDARRELGRAHEMFTAMGAAGFAERARAELVAAGASVRRPRGTADELTAHEMRIAKLAAGGATNQQIATELFISPNTVEYHLRKVFRKLGVESRRQLDAAALGS